jgi:protein-disulfide isomerase
LLKQYPKSVKVVYKNFPLSSHKFAKQAAAAALAAERQGKFWEYHDELFKYYRNLNDKKFVEIAQQLGLDEAKFNKDRHDPAILGKINLEYEEGEALEVKGIPAVFMNGRRIQNRDLGKIQDIIEKQLKKGQ